MRPLRTFVLGLTLVVPLASAPILVPAAVGSTRCAAAAGGEPHAGLVVGTGQHTTTYCVALDAQTVNGIHLIELASTQYGLQYRLGFGGKAVCQLDGVGPDGDNCFGDYPFFWGYWHGDGGTGWTWASSGAGSASVGDGDMDAWTWGTGDSGDTHPAPPPLGFGDVCTDSTPSPSPSPSASPTSTPRPPPSDSPPPPHGGGNGGGASSGTAPTSPSESPGSAQPATGGSAEVAGGAQAGPSSGSPASSGDGIVQAAPVASNGHPGGPPVGAFLAVAAALALGLAGTLRLRKGRRVDAPPGPREDA